MTSEGALASVLTQNDCNTPGQDTAAKAKKEGNKVVCTSVLAVVPSLYVRINPLKHDLSTRESKYAC